MKKAVTSYQELKAELDDLLNTLQQADTDIDATLAGYERGMKLIEQLEHYLDTAENKFITIKSAKE